MSVVLQKNVNNYSDLFDNYVKILNGVLRLSNRESELLSKLLFHDWNNTYGAKKNINSREIRLMMMESMNIKDGMLSTLLHTLKKIKVIIRSDEGKWVINPSIQLSNIEDITLIYKLSLVERKEVKNEPIEGFKEQTTN